MRKSFVVVLLFTSATFLRADFTYTETTQMTGGTMVAMMRSLGPLAGKARDPIVSTHIVKGNRQATVTRNNISIIDLDKETITNVDTEKKQYSVMTFAQMKQQMEEALAKMQGRQKDDVKANFKIAAKATGNTKTVQGLNAKEIQITMTTEFADGKSGQSGAMDILTDSWVAPVPGYEELREFNKKMAVKLGATFGSGMQQIAQMNPGQGNMTQSMEELAKEMQKLDGIPVESLVKMGPAGTMNAAAPAPAANEAACSAGSPSPQTQGSTSAAGALAGALGGRLGGLGGFGRKKKEEAAPAAQPAAGCDASAPAAAGGTLMEMTMTLTSFSSAADISKLDVPAGFKQVEARGAR
ncbi:MAG: hypothetical protein ABL995_14815 [Bryobacteraceae bacterium]